MAVSAAGRARGKEKGGRLAHLPPELGEGELRARGDADEGQADDADGPEPPEAARARARLSSGRSARERVGVDHGSGGETSDQCAALCCHGREQAKALRTGEDTGE